MTLRLSRGWPAGAFTLALSLATVALAAGPAPSPPAAGDQTGGNVWTAVAASGQVESLPLGVGVTDWIRLTRGDDLEPRSRVRTGRRGRTTLARPASVILVDPRSEIELPDDESREPTRVMQQAGSVVYEIDGRAHGDFRVVTPYLVAGVKGTRFLVTVGEHGASVTVEEGIVEVLSVSGRRAEIGPGRTALVDTEEGAELEVIEPAPGRSGGSREDAAVRKIARREVRRLERILADARQMGLLAASADTDPLSDPGSSDVAEVGVNRGTGEDELLEDDRSELDPQKAGSTDSELKQLEEETMRDSRAGPGSADDQPRQQ